MIGYNFNAAGTSNLWKFVSGLSPDEIDIDSTKGVTGIKASLPADTNFKQVLSSTIIPGAKVSGNIWTNGVLTLSLSIAELAGVKYVLLSVDNNVTGEQTTYALDDTFGITEEAFDTADSFIRTVTKVGELVTQGDIVSGDNSERFFDLNGFSVTVKPGNVQAFRSDVKADGLRLEGTIIAGTLFRVRNDGKIFTNQLNAPGVHAVLTFEIPVYNSAGTVIQGYIPVFT